MSDTPRTDLQIQVARTQGHDGYVHASFARVLEMEIADNHTEFIRLEAALRKELAERYADTEKVSGELQRRIGELNSIRVRVVDERDALRKEIAEVTAAFQKECDHDFEKVDDSFSHEFGTEVIRYLRCEKCGKVADWDDVPDGPEPDYDAIRERNEEK